MAVLIEGLSLLFKCASIAGKYEGGVEGFKSDLPNDSLRADGQLAAVTFLHLDEVRQFVATVESKGLIRMNGSGAVDMVVVDQRTGFCSTCAWASFGFADFEGIRGQRVAICTVDTDVSDSLVVPDGWRFTGSLSDYSVFVELPDE